MSSPSALHRVRPLAPRLARASRFAAATMLLALALACGGGGGGPVDVGSSLPVPDMSKVSFSESIATGEFVVTGLPEAVAPDVVVVAENTTQARSSQATATAGGSFQVVAEGSARGDVIRLRVERDGESSEGAELVLDYEGEAAPDPLEVEVYPAEGEPGFEVEIRFPDEAGPQHVIAANARTGQVGEADTERELDGEVYVHKAEVVLDAVSGDLLRVYAVRPGAPGRFWELIVP